MHEGREPFVHYDILFPTKMSLACQCNMALAGNGRHAARANRGRAATVGRKGGTKLRAGSSELHFFDCPFSCCTLPTSLVCSAAAASRQPRPPSRPLDPLECTQKTTIEEATTCAFSSLDIWRACSLEQSHRTAHRVKNANFVQKRFQNRYLYKIPLIRQKK